VMHSKNREERRVSFSAAALTSCISYNAHSAVCNQQASKDPRAGDVFRACAALRWH
jgi:hypothetical protein